MAPTPTDPAAAVRAAAHPLTLPRLIMRRAAWVAGLVLLAALGLGLLRMADDIDDEVDAAMSLAHAMARLAHLAQTDDRAALASLRALQAEHPLRHLLLQVHGADGQVLLAPAPPPAAGGLHDALAGLHRAVFEAGPARSVAWPVPRPDGRRWTVTLTASPDSERREALASFLDTLALLLASVAGLLLVMRWNLRRALAPLSRLLDSIAGIEAHDTQAVQALPPMPVGELEALAAALRHLGGALEAAEAERRLLSRQVLTLQEDERARLARELHDEFGQRLTAMRVDATWLGRRLAAMGAGTGTGTASDAMSPPAADVAELQPVVAGLVEQCACIQQDIRALLTRLQPFGGGQGGQGGKVGPGAEPGAGAAEGEPPERLAALLQALVQGWASSARTHGLQCQLQLTWQADAQAAPAPWSALVTAGGGTGPVVPAPLQLPRPLALALYRITQEALTNVARHARAQQAHITLRLLGPAVAGAPLQVHWSVMDDGVGLADALPLASQRGNGLAGLRERVWALGGELLVAPAAADAARPGLRLAAHLQARWLAAPAEAGA